MPQQRNLETPMRQEPLLIGARKVGPGCPSYIVAEIGINHNGDMALAREMIVAARDAGADAVKFQSYRTEDFVPGRDATYTYVSQGREVTESQFDMFKRYELSDDDVASLHAFASEAGVDFHATPTSEAGVNLLRDLGVGVLKNGSDFLSHLPLIKAMAETGLPTVISTGMADAEDITAAVEAFRSGGSDKLILLHCVSSYPTPPAEVNLRRMQTLAETYGCLVGFSDHSEGSFASALAPALGGCWIEKHFTLSRDLPGPDHRFSSDPAEFAELVANVRMAETLLGSPALGATGIEDRPKTDFRLSCAAARDLPAGHVVESGDVAFFRPGDGIPPIMVGRIVGTVLKKAVARGDQFRPDELGPDTR